jgi:hypothetical protein
MALRMALKYSKSSTYIAASQARPLLHQWRTCLLKDTTSAIAELLRALEHHRSNQVPAINTVEALPISHQKNWNNSQSQQDSW